MSDILFGQSYFLRFDPKLWSAMQPYPPLGTLYAASVIRSNGYQVAFFDAMLALSEQEWAEALDRERPRFAVLYEDNFNYLSKMCLLRMRQAAFLMIDLACQRGCTVILCGADASDHARLYFDHGARYVLQGEGEYTLLELLDTLTARSSKPLDEIEGLVFRMGAAPLTWNTRRSDIRDLDALPYPAWDLVDIERYRTIWKGRHGYFSMNLVSTRGCPFHCNWCAKPIWGQRYNSRSPENVVAEMAWVAETYHPDHIGFVDDIFGLKPGWLKKFAACIERQPSARLPYKCLSRVDLLGRPDEIVMLSRSGCKTVWVGAESGSQKILDAMEKGTRVSQIYECSRKLREAGIDVGFFLQFGYPGETHADIDMTLQMVRDCMPDDIGMSVSYPMPGTRFYNQVRGHMGAKTNWQDSSDLAMLYEGPYGTPFYRQLHGVLHHEFRARKHLSRITRLIAHPKQFTPSHLRQLSAMVYHAIALLFSRMRLNRLAARSVLDLDALQPQLSNQQAAVPSAQPER